MGTPAKTLEALLREPTINDHEEILKICNAALKLSKGDLQLQNTKFVALLKLDRYDDALRILEENGDKLKKQAEVGRAYALYRTGRLEEATNIAKGILNDQGATHVEAQALYRSGDFANAAESYKILIESQVSVGVEGNDLRINSIATDAQLEWARQGHLVQRKKPAREDLESFETAYNAACCAIARNDLGQGEALLIRAKDLCNSNEELTEGEKIAEILPITVQQLYVLNKLDKLDEAEKLASDVIIRDIPDLSTRQIAQNNQLVATPKTRNPYIDHRLFNAGKQLPPSDRLFQLQAELMQQNELAIDLLILKPDGVINKTSRMLARSPSSISAHANKISILNAAAHAQSQLAKLGVKRILPLIKKRPKDIGLVMTIVHLYVLTSNYGSAIAVLESLLKDLSDFKEPADQDVLYAPGLVALQVSLYSSQGRRSQIKKVFAKAASYWRHKSKPQIALFEAAGLSLLESPNPEHQMIVRDIFSALHTQDPSSKFATAGYVAAHALTAPDKVSAEIETLTPVARLIAGINIDKLESAGVPSLPTRDTNTNARKRALEEKPKPTKKRIRKSRMPQDFELNKTMDPERWLPLRDRSSYRPKGKKGRQRAAEKTQGGVSEKTVEKAGRGEAVIKAIDKPGGGQGKAKKKKGKK